MTDYLGRYITDHYNLPDRRDDAAYEHWTADYDDYMTYKLGRITMQTDVANVLSLLHDSSFSARIAVRSGEAAAVMRF